MKTNFDAVLPVSFGEEWNCVEKINLFVHLYRMYWLTLQNNLEYLEYLNKKKWLKQNQRIPQEVTYGENPVKDNSICEEAK